jgi:hypothetical protein
MKSFNLNTADLARLYVGFDTPVDALATDPERLGLFTAAVNRDCGLAGNPMTGPEVLKALLNARKRGFLPRLRRSA